MIGDIFYVIALVIFGFLTIGIFRGHFYRKMNETNKNQNDKSVK